jgi:hypothetical protein
MKRKLFRAIPVAVVAGAAVAGGVLLWTQSWGGEEEAAATPSEYSFCNVSLQVPPDMHVGELTLPKRVDGVRHYLIVNIPLAPAEKATTDPDTGERIGVLPSGVALHPQTGEIVSENYRSAVDEAKLKAVIETLRVGPPSLSTPAWPLTELSDHEAQVSKIVNVEYRHPERGSGVLIGSDAETFIDVETCSSRLRLNAATGESMEKDIQPADEAAFDRVLQWCTGCKQ